MRAAQIGRLTARLFWMVLGMAMSRETFADPSRELGHHSAEVSSLGDVRIHHRLYAGSPAGSSLTLVLVHGWSCDATYWDAQLPALVEHHPVLTVDLAGHGRSSGSREDISIAAFATDVARAVEQAIPSGSIVLIGHSMGGPVAIEAARQLGSRVHAIIGVDTFKNIGLPPPDPVQTEARLQFFAADFQAATSVFVSQTFFREDADPALKTRIAQDMAAGDPTVGIAAIRALNDWDGVEALSALQQSPMSPLPILAINAKHGAPTDLSRLQGIYPQFSLREMDGVGHFLMMEQPSAFNALLLQEIARLSHSANR